MQNEESTYGPGKPEVQSQSDMMGDRELIARIAVEGTSALVAALAHANLLNRHSRAVYYTAVISDEDAVNKIVLACKTFGKDPTFLRDLSIYVQMMDDSNGAHYSRPAKPEAEALWVVHQMQLACALTTATLEHAIHSTAAAAALTAANTLITKRHYEVIKHVRAAAAYPPNKLPAWFHLPSLVAAVAGMSKPLTELTIRAIMAYRQQQDRTALCCCRNMGERLLHSSRCCGFWLSKRLLLAADEALCQVKVQPDSSEADSQDARSAALGLQPAVAARWLVRQLIARRWRVSQGEEAAVRIGIINRSKPLPREGLVA